MPPGIPLNRPGIGFAIPQYYNRTVIPQASVRTLFSVPVPIFVPDPNIVPFMEHVTIEKKNGVAYSGSTSTNLIIDAAYVGGGTVAALSLTQSLILGITAGKSTFRNFGGSDVGDYSTDPATYQKYYQIRLSVAGSDFSAGTGDVIVEMYYSAVWKAVRF